MKSLVSKVPLFAMVVLSIILSRLYSQPNLSSPAPTGGAGNIAKAYTSSPLPLPSPSPDDTSDPDEIVSSSSKFSGGSSPKPQSPVQARSLLSGGASDGQLSVTDRVLDTDPPEPLTPPTDSEQQSQNPAAENSDSELGGSTGIMDLEALNAKGETPVVDFNGKKAFEVTYQAGKIHPSGSNGGVFFSPNDVFPTEQVRVKFNIYFADNFPWDKTESHKVGGKLGGFKIGTGDASGGNYSDTGSSYRLTFHDGGVATGYFYPQLKQSISSDSLSWDTMDQSPQLQAVSKITTGISVWRNEGNLHYKKGQWNAIEMFIKLNTPGQYDGVMELSVNGVKERLDVVRYRYDNALIENFNLTTFFGGGDNSYAPPETTKAWFSDYSFSDYGK